MDQSYLCMMMKVRHLDQQDSMPKLNNNQYVALVGEEDDEDKDTKSTGLENNGEITGVRHDNEITGIDSDNEST